MPDMYIKTGNNVKEILLYAIFQPLIKNHCYKVIK